MDSSGFPRLVILKGDLEMECDGFLFFEVEWEQYQDGSGDVASVRFRLEGLWLIFILLY